MRTSRLRRSRLALLAAASAMTIAACGTTVHVEGSVASGGTGLDGSSLGLGTTDTGTDSSGPLTDVPSSTPSASADDEGPTSNPDEDYGGTTGSGGSTTQVASSTPIEIGSEYVSQSGITAAAKLIGLDLDLGPLLAEENAMVAHLNAQGGINGHPIKLVTFEESTSASNDTNSQAACSTWTEDHHVVAALTLLLESTACLAKKRVIEIQGYNSANTPLASSLKQYPLFSIPNGLTLDRLARTYGEFMGSSGYFSSPANAKLGILYNDTPSFATAFGILKSALAGKGIKVASASTVPAFSDFASIAAISNSLSSSILQFRAAGVTHVMFLDNSTTASYLFAQQAANQNYYPRYGLNGSDAMTIFAANNKNDPKILAGSQVLGYTPAYDTHSAADYSTPAAKACAAIYAKAGVKVPSGPNPIAYSLLICDAFRYISATLTAGGANTPDAFLTGRAQLAQKGFDAAMTFGSSGSPDGVRKLRIAAYTPSCGCYKYTGPVISAP